MQDGFRSLFRFSKKERRSVLLLCALVVFARTLPWLVEKISPPSFPEIRAEKIETLASVSAMDAAVFSAKITRSSGGSFSRQDAIRPFYFDPNTATEESWRKMGLDSFVARTIKNYLEKGGRFRKPEDLLKIRKLHRDQAQRLIPFVRIPDSFHVHKKREGVPDLSVLEINAADSIQWLSLPGIGPVLAGRILSFKRKLGGFHDVHQLQEVYGLKDSLFLYIRPRLTVDSAVLLKISLNRADYGILAAHPYIRREAARAIITYRNSHGAFHAVDQLLLILSLDSPWLDKVRPYLSVE